MTTTKNPTPQPKPPIRWTGVLFAFAANLLFVNVVDQVVRRVDLALPFEALATLVVPVLVGIATHFYVGRRAGIHAFIGGIASIPFLALWTFNGNWQFAILAGAFCGLGGAVTEVLLRPRTAGTR